MTYRVASTTSYIVLTTEAVVADIPEPASAMPDMSGMGGMPGMM
ncbi:hypothetical protein [Lysinibacillus sp. NPDC093688]